MLEGRVEVHYNNDWITVCDDGWDLNDAQVVCNEFGFGPAIATSHEASYGQSSGRVWLRNVNCVGTELTIRNCLHGGWRIGNCSHSKDASVKCKAGM